MSREGGVVAFDGGADASGAKICRGEMEKENRMIDIEAGRMCMVQMSVSISACYEIGFIEDSDELVRGVCAVIEDGAEEVGRRTGAIGT